MGLHSCPDPSVLRGELRLTLGGRQPPSRLSVGSPPKLPLFYVLDARPEAPAVTRQAGRWLGQTRAVVEATLKPSGTERNWVRYGEHLALRYEGNLVVALRAHVALGMTCEAAAAWLGYRGEQGRAVPLRRRWGCEWPGLSERHRLAPKVAGRREGVLFDVSLR